MKQSILLPHKNYIIIKNVNVIHKNVFKVICKMFMFIG